MATPEYHIVNLGLGINRRGTSHNRKGTRGNRSSSSVQRRDTSTNHTSLLIPGSPLSLGRVEDMCYERRRAEASVD